jgi:hypothetical protein
MADRKPQINLVVTEEQKTRWEEYLNKESDEFRSLSQLIRRSVEKQVNEQTKAGDGGVSEDLTRQLSEIAEGMNRIESQMRDFDGRLSTIEQEIRDDPDIKQLANEVFALLPTKEEVIEYEKTSQQAGAEPPHLPQTDDGTVSTIAEVLDKKELRIEQALDQLQQDTNQVNEFTLGEEVPGWSETYDGGEALRYYKQG